MAAKETTTEPEDDPELVMNELDDQDVEEGGAPAAAAQKKKQVTVRLPSQPEVTPTPPKPQSKLHRFLHLLKIVLLFLCWLVFAICLNLTDERRYERNLLVVPVNGEKLFNISALALGERVGVDVMGPLKNGEAEPGDSVLSMQIVSAAAPAVANAKPKIVPLSDVWKLPVTVKEFSQMQRDTKHSHVFELTTTATTTTSSDRRPTHLQIISDFNVNMALEVSFDTKPVDKQKGIIFGAIVLLFLYAMIIWEIINRTFASIIAATLSIAILAMLNARPSLGDIMAWVDVETLLLLFGMMILVAILSESGVFDYLAVYAYKITGGRLWPLINCLCLFTSFLSAFLDNVTMMLLVTPVIIRLCEVTALDPVPVIMFLVLYSNIGAATTPVGDPPNVIITTNSYMTANNINFGNFFLHMIPGVMIAMLQTYIQLRLKFPDLEKLRSKGTREENTLLHEIHVWERAAAGISTYSKDEDLVRDTLKKKVDSLKRRISASADASQPQAAVAEPNFEETLEQLRTAYPIRNKTLLIKSAFAFMFVIMLFFLHSLPHFHYLTLGWTALIGAFLLLILADVEDMESILGHVEWSTLLFFACLFVLMEALSQLGLIEIVGNFVIDMILLVDPDKRLMLALLIILWVTAIASAFLDNIPVTTMMVRIIVTLAENKTLNLPLQPLVWALAFGACFGGNGTLIGASANVVSAGVAEQHGYKFTFMNYFRMGFPVMLGNVCMAMLYLMVAHVLFEWH